jgi:hypothetical protein
MPRELPCPYRRTLDTARLACQAEVWLVVPPAAMAGVAVSPRRRRSIGA